MTMERGDSIEGHAVIGGDDSEMSSGGSSLKPEGIFSFLLSAEEPEVWNS
jgi:hypothetical protein